MWHGEARSREPAAVLAPCPLVMIRRYSCITRYSVHIMDVMGQQVLTNGRIRAIINLLTSMDEYKNFASPPKLSLVDKWRRYVLEQLRQLQDKQSYESPFDMVSAPFEVLAQWRNLWEETKPIDGHVDADAASTPAQQYGMLISGML
jgi:hypothetical protein